MYLIKSKAKIAIIFFIILFSILFQKNDGFASKQIAINRKSATVAVGDSVKLIIRNTKQKVKWSSVDKSIASVSASGKVIGKKVGKVVIKAKVGKRDYICKVTIDNPQLNAIALTLAVNESYNLQVYGTKRSVIWKSTNKNVIEVDNEEITGINPGKAEVLAIIGDIELKCDVIVVSGESKITPTNITLNQSNIILDTPGQTVSLTARLFPTGADSTTALSWYSDNPYVATVDSSVMYC